MRGSGYHMRRSEGLLHAFFVHIVDILWFVFQIVFVNIRPSSWKYFAML